MSIALLNTKKELMFSMIGKGFVYRGNRVSPSQFLMMLMMRNGPMYGYEVLITLRDEFTGMWEPQTGALYPALKRLQDHGLLKVSKREGKDYYQITVEGEKWMWETIDNISDEVRFLSRYIDVLAQAAMERIPDPNAPAGEKINRSLPWQLLHLVEDFDNPSVRLATKRMVKGMLEQKLKELEKEIQLLEGEDSTS
jgi:DNA-binding PadR family transcriptional regulator